MERIQKFMTMLVVMAILWGGHNGTFANTSKPQEIQGIKVYMDGNKFETNELFYDFNNTTLVPMREFFEALGASLEWDKEAQEILATTEDKTIELMINNKTAKINGKDNFLSVPPKIINNHTYVPLRFIAEALMREVDWDRDHNIISIIDMQPINKKMLSKRHEISDLSRSNRMTMEMIDNSVLKVKGQAGLNQTG